MALLLPSFNWRLIGGLATALVLFGNPWSQGAYFNAILQRVWAPDLILDLAIAAGALGGFAMVITLLTLVVFVSGEDKDEPRTSRRRNIAAVTVMFAGVFLIIVPLLSKSVVFSQAGNAVENLKTAERSLGTVAAIRPQLEKATRSMSDVKRERAFLVSISTAASSPEKMMAILAAADAMGNDQPAASFVLANGMARQEDIVAIQAALLQQARHGNGRANVALLNLASVSGEGGGK